jgi:hypothetical protein
MNFFTTTNVIIILALLLAAFALMLALALIRSESHDSWARCLECRSYFNGHGITTKEMPATSDGSVVHYGFCPHCIERKQKSETKFSRPSVQRERELHESQ